MIRRDLLKGFLTGVAALAMGRSAKADMDIAPHSLPRTEPVKVLDHPVELKRNPYRVLRSIQVQNPHMESGMGVVSTTPKDGKERALITYPVSQWWLNALFVECHIFMAEDETLSVYARDGKKRTPLSYDVLFINYDESERVSYHHQVVRV